MGKFFKQYQETDYSYAYIHMHYVAALMLSILYTSSAVILCSETLPINSGSGLQSCILQDLLSVSQLLPPSVQPLLLNCVPLPHDSVHSLQSVHSDEVPAGWIQFIHSMLVCYYYIPNHIHAFIHVYTVPSIIGLTLSLCDPSQS